VSLICLISKKLVRRDNFICKIAHIFCVSEKKFIGSIFQSCVASTDIGITGSLKFTFNALLYFNSITYICMFVFGAPVPFSQIINGSVNNKMLLSSVKHSVNGESKDSRKMFTLLMYLEV
jgi:hypothetical protein